MKNILLSSVLLFSILATAQEGKVEGKPADKKLDLKSYYNSDKKLGFTERDSLFQVNIGFRVQSRAGFQKTDGETGVVEGEIRRMRLKLDGFIYNPKFGYKVELGFSAGDLGVIKAGNNENVILDGVLFYKPTDKWTIAFGQTKLPGNNQRVISSGSLEFTDRTINNSKFNIDRDFGVFIDYAEEKPNNFSYALKGAITKGEGRNWVKTEDDGIALTGKVELFPLGAFTKNGSHSEGDLIREKTPKWMISGAFSQNNNARRAQGQLGNELFEKRTLQSLFFDTMLKYNGWSATASYMSRMSDDPITVNPLDVTKTQAVFVGEGFDTQLSYVFPSKYQIAGRFSTQTVDSEIHAFTPDTDEYAVSLSKYIFGHKLKVQTECSYENKKFISGDTSGSWYVRMQVEIGI
ncbi:MULTISPECIES: porin [unclassified Flavobacterium]|uniref:porin n=1 Tax=unclassified Flavobacterium TaxID=196869 RepID=UPI003F937135